jgi:hypothetical protein
MYWGIGCTDPRFLASALVGGQWSASHPGRFTPGESPPCIHWIGGWVDCRAGLYDIEKWKFLPPPGLELRPLCRAIRDQSLHRLLMLSAGYTLWADRDSPARLILLFTEGGTLLPGCCQCIDPRTPQLPIRTSPQLGRHVEYVRWARSRRPCRGTSVCCVLPRFRTAVYSWNLGACTECLFSRQIRGHLGLRWKKALLSRGRHRTSTAFSCDFYLDLSSSDPEVELFMKFLPCKRYRLMKLLLRVISLLVHWLRNYSNPSNTRIHLFAEVLGLFADRCKDNPN